MRKLLPALLLCCSAAAGTPATNVENEHYRLHYTSRMEPIVINRIHSWVVHVENADGKALEGCALEIAGTMPAHDHGLPTRPRVTEELGNGDYLVEGMRFHMNGDWEVTVTIGGCGPRDSLVIPLTL